MFDLLSGFESYAHLNASSECLQAHAYGQYQVCCCTTTPTCLVTSVGCRSCHMCQPAALWRLRQAMGASRWMTLPGTSARACTSCCGIMPLSTLPPRTTGHPWTSTLQRWPMLKRMQKLLLPVSSRRHTWQCRSFKLRGQLSLITYYQL